MTQIGVPPDLQQTVPIANIQPQVIIVSHMKNMTRISNQIRIRARIINVNNNRLQDRRRAAIHNKSQSTWLAQVIRPIKNKSNNKFYMGSSKINNNTWVNNSKIKKTKRIEIPKQFPNKITPASPAVVTTTQIFRILHSNMRMTNSRE